MADFDGEAFLHELAERRAAASRPAPPESLELQEARQREAEARLAETQEVIGKIVGLGKFAAAQLDGHVRTDLVLYRPTAISPTQEPFNRYFLGRPYGLQRWVNAWVVESPKKGSGYTGHGNESFSSPGMALGSNGEVCVYEKIGWKPGVTCHISLEDPISANADGVSFEQLTQIPGNFDEAIGTFLKKKMDDLI